MHNIWVQNTVCFQGMGSGGKNRTQKDYTKKRI